MAKGERFELRLEEGDLALFREAAVRSGERLSAWMRRVLAAELAGIVSDDTPKARKGGVISSDTVKVAKHGPVSAVAFDKVVEYLEEPVVPAAAVAAELMSKLEAVGSQPPKPASDLKFKRHPKCQTDKCRRGLMGPVCDLCIRLNAQAPPDFD